MRLSDPCPPSRPRRRVRWLLPLLAALALTAAACGDDGSATSGEDTAGEDTAGEDTAGEDGGTELPEGAPAFCASGVEIRELAASDLGGADPAAVEAAYTDVVTFFAAAAEEAPEDVAGSVGVLAGYLADLNEVFASVGYVAADVPLTALELYTVEVAEATGSVDRWFGRECALDLTPDDPNGAAVDTGGFLAFVPSELDPEAPAPGPDAALDALWDACGTGDDAACDELYATSPSGSQYEGFGATCGARTPFDPQRSGGEPCAPGATGETEQAVGGLAGYVEGTELTPGSPAPGPDPDLDELWTSCGGGGLAACDELYASTPFGSLYEAYAVTCGGREPYDPAAYDGCAAAPAG